jgi:hypothetical protein
MPIVELETLKLPASLELANQAGVLGRALCIRLLSSQFGLTS